MISQSFSHSPIGICIANLKNRVITQEIRVNKDGIANSLLKPDFYYCFLVKICEKIGIDTEYTNGIM